MNLDPGDLILRDPNQKDFISLSNLDLEFRFKGFRCKGPGFKELRIMCFLFLVYIWETYFQRLSFKGPNLKDLFIRNLGLGDLDLRDLILRDLVLREPVRLLTSMLRIPRTDKCDEKVLLCSGFQYSECILMFHVEVKCHKR